MRIFIDIGHPAHVHYFRHFLEYASKEDISFIISARQKEVTHELLNLYNIPYFSRGKGSKSFFGKFVYMLLADLKLLILAIKFKPDLFLSFSSPYAAQVSFLLGKPHISLDDTEHAKIGHFFYVPFTKVIISPFCYKKSFGQKHILVDSFFELFYLHKNIFTPDLSILDSLNIKNNEKYVIVRFIAWGASHDFGQSGLDDKSKFQLIEYLSNKVKVFISSEEDLPKELEKYRLNISPDKIHNILHFASLYIGEGATMASEAVMLGTPAIYINSLSAGTLEIQENSGLLFSLKNSDDVINKCNDIFDHKQNFEKKSNSFLSKKINITFFLLWFVKNYPKSLNICKKHDCIDETFYNLFVRDIYE